MDKDWSVSPIMKQNKEEAWSQLGTSGSGNHFVEFGIFTAHEKIATGASQPLLGAQALLDLENHHNFAWKEKHVIAGMEREVSVHRKGATPGLVASGKGNAESLNSASHGAGRAMSRKAPFGRK